MHKIFSNVGYSFYIPLSLLNKRDLLKHEEFADMLYNSIGVFKYPKTRQEYLNYYEFVMRGFFVTNNLLEKSQEWHYISIDSDTKSNAFCSKLLMLKPINAKFTDSLYGKKDSYLNGVPVECLYQYFENISFEKFFKICGEYAQIRSVEYLKSQSLSIVTEIMTKKYMVERLISRKIFYLEDLLETKQFFMTLCERMTKKELQMTQRFLLSYFDLIN